MKKILFLLLCTVQIYGQVSTGQEQEFDYGIKNNSTQTITTPPYLTTTGMDGTQGKIPSALIAKTSDIADSLATKENIANKTDSYTTSSSTAYVSGKALVEGLDTKAPLSGSTNYIQNQNASAQSANMWINGSIKAKNIQTLDDVSGFYTYGRYSSGQPYSLNILSDAAQGFKFTNSSAIPLLTIESSGAALFTSTVTASSFNGSATLTGISTAPTAAPGTTGNQIATLDYVNTALRPYKVYTALLSQTGTSAPTATVLENTIGAIVWSRSVIGGYFATLSGAFTTDKTSVLITNGSANATYIHGAQVSTSNVSVITVADGQIDKATIEIRVYN